MLISGSRDQWKETGGFKNSTTAWCHWPTSHQPPNNSSSTSFTWWSHPSIDKQAEQSSAVPMLSNDPLRDDCFAFSHLPVLICLPVWRFKVSPSQWSVVTVMNNMRFSSSSCPGLDYSGQGCVQGNGCKEPRGRAARYSSLSTDTPRAQRPVFRLPLMAGRAE